MDNENEILINKSKKLVVSLRKEKKSQLIQNKRDKL
jgi:hypothetical protein